jgi:hypothetical protein
MEFGITIPFQKFLKVKQPPYGEALDLFFCWDCNRVLMPGGSTLFVINSSNRFAAIVSGMKGADWKKWKTIAVGAIRRSLSQADFNEKVINDYFALAGEQPVITKTHGRKSVGNMNQLIEDQWYQEPLPHPYYQDEMCWSANLKLITRAANFSGYGFASEFFQQDLERCGIGKKVAKIIPFPGKKPS